MYMSRDNDIVVFEHEREQVTIGDLREWHYLEVSCPTCGRVGRVYPTTLLKRYAANTRIADLASSFSCGRCKAKGSRRWAILKIDRNV